MWADRAFQMLCPVQPERKSECTFQDALKSRRGRRDKEGGGLASLFLGLRLWMAVSAFGTSARCDCHFSTVTDTAERVTCGTTKDAGPHWGRAALGSCTPGVCGASPPSPHPLLGGGKWRGSVCGKAGVPLSVLPPPAPLSSAGRRCSPPPGVALKERGTAGDVFWMFGFARSGAALEESQIPCTLPKMYQGAGTSLVHPWLPGGFSVLFLLFFFFFFSSTEKADKIKKKPQF